MSGSSGERNWRWPMTLNDLLQIGLFIGVLLLLVKPLGAYMARVYEGETIFGLDRLLGPIERFIYRLCGAAVARRWAGKTTPSRCFSSISLALSPYIPCSAFRACFR